MLNLHARPDEAKASGLEKRLMDLLQRYGAEFPEEPSPRRYAAHVRTLVDWSQSPEFPGKT